MAAPGTGRECEDDRSPPGMGADVVHGARVPRDVVALERPSPDRARGGGKANDAEG